MWRRVRGILRPSGFHGELFAPPFFEGWYVKLVGPAAQERLAVIIGVFEADRTDETHAFLQLFDGRRGEAASIRFERRDFRGSAGELDVTLGSSGLTERGLSLAVDRAGHQLRGRIDFGPLAPWPVRLASPGAMGWYGW